MGVRAARAGARVGSRPGLGQVVSVQVVEHLGGTTWRVTMTGNRVELVEAVLRSEAAERAELLELGASAEAA